MSKLLLLVFFVNIIMVHCDEFYIQSKKHHKPECDKRLGEFSDIQKDFIQCAIKYGTPVDLCSKCLNHFVDTNVLYEQLTTLYNGINCKDHFIDKDRLNVITIIYQQGLSVWDKAFCTDCYDWKPNTRNLNFSAETANLKNLLNKTAVCIQAHYGEACSYCSAEYLELNDLYISMDKMKSSKICFDIQDDMNKTRSLWSIDMKCCKERQSSMIGFTLLSTSCCIIVVLFYIVVPYLEIRSEQSNFISNSEPENENITTDETENIRGNIVSGIINKAKNKVILNKKGNEDSDSDAEPLDGRHLDEPMIDLSTDDLVNISDESQPTSSKKANMKKFTEKYY